MATVEAGPAAVTDAVRAPLQPSNPTFERGRPSSWFPYPTRRMVAVWAVSSLSMNEAWPLNCGVIEPSLIFTTPR